jgi:hypothetical protein
VRHDLRDRRLHGLVAARVVAVVMRVDEQVDLPRGARLQSLEEERGGVGELAVDDDDRIGRDEVADRPAARGEQADVAPHVLEHGRGRRLLAAARRLREERPAAQGPGEA